jgi:hypothetical protein
MMGDRVVERSVLQVPIRFEGGPDSVFLQLDTGSDRTMLYEVPYREVRVELPTPPPRFVHDRVTIGPVDASRDTFWIRPGAGRPLASTGARTMGTLGADFLRHRVLVLDFPNVRFALLDTSQALPPSVEGRVRWTPLIPRDGKLFVRALVAGEAYNDLFFDSGSSAFPIIVRRELWSGWTGRAVGDPSNEVWSATSWGTEIPLIGAPLSGDLVIAGIHFPRPLAFHHGPVAGIADFFASSSYPVRGYFGNALFFDRFVVVVDVPRSRFGLLDVTVR